MSKMNQRFEVLLEDIKGKVNLIADQISWLDFRG